MILEQSGGKDMPRPCDIVSWRQSWGGGGGRLATGQLSFLAYWPLPVCWAELACIDLWLTESS